MLICIVHWNPLSLIIRVTEVSEPILCIIHLFEITEKGQKEI